MSGIEVSREKIDVAREYAGGAAPRLTKVTVPCNRMILPMRNRRTNEKIAIRGKSITGVLHMAQALIACYRERGTVMDEGAARGFARQWLDSLSIFDTRFMPGNWIAVYCNGSKIFSTADAHDVDVIERIARGGPLREDMLERHRDLFQSDAQEQIGFHYDSQLAVVINDQEKAVKCSILERSISSEGTLSFTFPKIRRSTMTQSIDLVTSIIESSTMFSQHMLTKAQAVKAKPDQERKMRKVMEEQRKRVNELHQAIKVTVKTNKVQFWPEEPNFIIT